VKSRWWEQAVLVVAVALLFRPDWFMDRLTPEFVARPASELAELARTTPAGQSLVLQIRGTNIEGDEIRKTVALPLGDGAADGRKRLADAGLSLSFVGDRVQITGVKFGSRARKAGIDQGFDVERVDVPSGRASPHWFYVPALLLIGVVWWTQGRRARPLRDSLDGAPPATATPRAAR